MSFAYSDYIVHYGVRGMKRGLRRWTNGDGTLNEAGKLRYRSGKVTQTTSIAPELKAVTTTSAKGSTTTKYINQRGKVAVRVSSSGSRQGTDAEVINDLSIDARIRQGKRAATKLLQTKAGDASRRAKNVTAKATNRGKKFLASLFKKGKK